MGMTQNIDNDKKKSRMANSRRQFNDYDYNQPYQNQEVPPRVPHPNQFSRQNLTYPSSGSFENKSTSNKDKNFDEVMDLNSYTTKKTATSGAIGFGLFSSNCEQLVSLIRIW